MTSKGSVRSLLSRYADFRGRSSRSEFWLAMSCVLVADLALAAVDRAAFGRPVLATAFEAAVAVPWLCLHARRLHDTGRSGLWLLAIPAIPLATGCFLTYAMDAPQARDGAAVAMFLTFHAVFLASFGTLLVWQSSRGTRGPNRFGPDPLQGVPA